MLTTAANNAHAASAAVPDGVEATAKNGNLTLTGAVKYPSQCAAAESAVGGLKRNATPSSAPHGGDMPSWP